MPTGPVLPNSGVLVFTFGLDASAGRTFESIEALRDWKSPSSVRRVQIMTNRQGYRAAAPNALRSDGARIDRLDDGILVIEAAKLNGTADPIGAVLAAYDWAYAER